MFSVSSQAVLEPYFEIERNVAGKPHSPTISNNNLAGLGWAGLGWAGLGWAGLGWAGTHNLNILTYKSCDF